MQSIYTTADKYRPIVLSILRIVVGGYFIEAAWYSTVGLLLSLPPARVVYGRFAKWIDRALGALMVGFGLRLLAAQSE